MGVLLTTRRAVTPWAGTRVLAPPTFGRETVFSLFFLFLGNETRVGGGVFALRETAPKLGVGSAASGHTSWEWQPEVSWGGFQVGSPLDDTPCCHSFGWHASAGCLLSALVPCFFEGHITVAVLLSRPLNLRGKETR